MKSYPQHEVAISDADRAEIEEMFIDLMRERAATQGGAESTESPIETPKTPGAR